MRPVLEALREKFAGRIRPLETRSADQLYAALDAADVPAVAEYLRTEHAARLVSVFAEDRVAAGRRLPHLLRFRAAGRPRAT